MKSSSTTSAPGVVMGSPDTRDATGLPAQSLQELFATHYARLCQLAARMVGDTARGEDVVMDAFLEVHRVVHRLNWETAPAYVRRAVVNRALRVLQRAAHEATLVDRAVRARHLPADVLYQDDLQTTSAERDRVLTAIASLPPREKVAIVLSFYDDLSVAQIAAAMDCREGTVKRYLSQARARLAKQLGQVRS